MLDVQGISAGYGPVQVLAEVSLHVSPGEIVALLGPNGAGKSTLMSTLVGIVPARSGEIRFDGSRVDGLTTEAIVSRGLALVPEGRRVFSTLTVEENLRMGAYSRRRGTAVSTLSRVLEVFPILRERRVQLAGTLSGGEQQQLAIARALMSNPTLLLLDEPSLGLAPVIVEQVFDLIRELNTQSGLSVLLVEQSISQALEISSRAYVMRGGEIVDSGTSEEVSDSARALEASYLGGA